VCTGACSYIKRLTEVFQDLLKIDYRAVVSATLDILRLLPPSIEPRVRDLVNLAVELASNKVLLSRDFAGRVYHEIAGGIALRKGFATFYTEVPAAYLLATLATLTLLDLEEGLLNLDQQRAREVVSRIESVKVGDFACGSGTLLTASYSALMRTCTALKFYYDLEDVDLSGIGKALIERGVYGIDALRYASQITAINLALMAPSAISWENTYTIYLGYIPEKNQPWLGSLELLRDRGRVGGILEYIEGRLDKGAERVTLEGEGGVFSIPDRFDIVIMNPPFTRPTYRGRKLEEEERAFFGFIADERVRKRLKERYLDVLSDISGDLRETAKRAVRARDDELKGVPDEIRGIITGEVDAKLRQYLNIGLAGEALPFLYLAYKYVKEGGVIAFVLPRAALAGISWFLARILLASKFHLKYVIVSSDSESGYNFSEGTSLSEILLVAKRVSKHEPSEETTFVILTKKPRTALEGVLVANNILEAKRKGAIQSDGLIIRTVNREILLKHIDNWNRFVAIPEPVLSDYTLKLLTSGTITINGYSIKIPLVQLGKILKTINIGKRKRGKSVKCIGIDPHAFYDLYTKVSISPYPALIGTEEEFRRTMRVKPNAYVAPKRKDVERKAIDTFRVFAGRVLVPGVNVWWDTSRVIALYSDQGVLSNTHYALKLGVDPSIEPYAEKALVLWLNTTWGLLSVLVNREETRGPWAQVKMGQWMLMPVLNVTSLDHSTLKRLAEVFDNYAERELRRIPEQFNPKDPDPVRLGIDKGLIKALNPTIDDKVLERELVELYRHVDIALRLWIGA
jgi:hypothetical protein